jgi:hypothetical protein
MVRVGMAGLFGFKPLNYGPIALPCTGRGSRDDAARDEIVQGGVIEAEPRLEF